MSRFLLRCADVGVEVYDATTGGAESGRTVFGPASYETASKQDAHLNAIAPCCACAGRLVRLTAAFQHCLDWIEQDVLPALYPDARERLERKIGETYAILRGDDDAV